VNVSGTGSLAIQGATVITMNERREVVRGDIVIQDGKIVAVGDVTRPVTADALDASGCVVIPGLVQAHTHLCQTLCRGAADDLPLLAWLAKRVWPYEASLDEAAMRAAARLGCAELLLSGTTCILDMGTVHETDALFEAVAETGLRATIGKAMMDVGGAAPARLTETTRDSLEESDGLRRRWDRSHGGRIRYAYSPRFALSASDALLREVGERVRSGGARVHTHASEQQAEIEQVRRERGQDNIRYLDECGIGGPRATLAHCVHATSGERELLAERGTHVVHCPSSNLKLGSGIAPIPEMLKLGVSVALGADGAPCNNNLDGFVELRLAALLHSPRVGPGALPALKALELATLGGARALGLEREIGSIEPGKRADLVVLDLRTPHATPAPDPVSAVVYSAQSCDVRDVLVDGRLLVNNRELTELTRLEVGAVVDTAAREAERVASRT
jgi:cytosine/adenosine deaminase-related metal-dependent hydrolase